MSDQARPRVSKWAALWRLAPHDHRPAQLPPSDYFVRASKLEVCTLCGRVRCIDPDTRVRVLSDVDGVRTFDLVSGDPSLPEWA